MDSKKTVPVVIKSTGDLQIRPGKILFVRTYLWKRRCSLVFIKVTKDS